MSVLNINKDKEVILILGMFVVLIINQLLDISLFISKVLSVYIFGNLDTLPYLFFSFVLIIFFLEFIFFIKNNYFTPLNFKRAIILLIVVYFLNYMMIYLESNILSIYVAENYERDKFLSFQLAFSYSKAAFIIHNILLIFFSIFKIRKRSG